MPDRIIRDEILESERWLALRDNTARICYFTLLLKADSLGNLEAHIPRLLRLWRDYGVTTPEAVASTLQELADCDLIRLYEATVDGGKQRYLHIPRYKQKLRYVKRVFPPSPWTTSDQKKRLAEQKQELAGNSQWANPVSATWSQGAHTRSEVEVEVDIKGSKCDAEGSARGDSTCAATSFTAQQGFPDGGGFKQIKKLVADCRLTPPFVKTNQEN